MPEQIDTLNYRKFQTGNPVVRAMFNGFYAKLGQVVRPLKSQSVLDAGCGEGETIERLRGLLPAQVTGIDSNPDCVRFCRERLPGLEFTEADACRLGFEDRSFDLVLCLEVLEHLPEPRQALRELNRVTRRDIVLSVPYEPWFRLGNLARLKYLSRLGDHPEHVQHWNVRTLRQLLEQELEEVGIRTAFPWLIAHARRRG